MEKYSFIKDLNESKLLTSMTSLHKYDLNDICNLTFLYFLTIQILKDEPSYAKIIQNYCNNTIKYDKFHNYYSTANDLYMLLFTLNNSDNYEYLNHIPNYKIFLDIPQIKQYLRNVSNNTKNLSFEKRFLLKLQNDLRIKNTNYKSMRRLIVEWLEVTKYDHKLVITRLLQAFRSKMPRSELYVYINDMAKINKLELKNVLNAENPETVPNNKINILKPLIIGIAVDNIYKYLKK